MTLAFQGYAIATTAASSSTAMLEALKRLDGGTIHLPNRTKDLPNRKRLAFRFERFRAAA
jgi:putative restriction endonuclease